MKLKEFYTFLKENRLKLSDKSLFILTIPYIINVFISTEIKVWELLLIPLFVFCIDLLFKNKYHFIFVSLYIYFLYSYIVYDDTNHVIHALRVRTFSIIFVLITAFVTYLSYKKKENIKALNVFILFLSLTFLYNPPEASPGTKSEILNKINSSYTGIPFENIEKSSDPVILIILDELGSRSEIYNYSKDSIDFDINKQLEKLSYKAYNRFTSLALGTNYSLPSIFNFNLHNSSYIKKIDTISDVNLEATKEFTHIFRDNLLVDSLIQKEVKTNSYGYVKFKKTEAQSLYLKRYPWDNGYNFAFFFKNLPLLNKLLSKSMLLFFEGKNFSGYNLFRRDVLSALKEFTPKKNNFYYFHILAPHAPYSYFDEYQSKNPNPKLHKNIERLNEQIKFSRFFLPKVSKILADNKFDNCRVIVTGDHGYRGFIGGVDPYLTSLYLKGYDSLVVKKEATVQDLGKLIYESFEP